MNKKIRKNKFHLRVLKVFATTLLVMFVICGAIVGAYAIWGDNLPSAKNIIQFISGVANSVTPGDKKERITVLVFGEDKAAGLTDVMMYVSVDMKTNKVDIISLPRDTRVEFDDQTYKVFSQVGKRLPEVIKMNSAANYYTKVDTYSAAENKEARYLFSKKVIEYKFGIKFDYYVQMDLNGFKQIVDAIGGVTMDVPRDLDYEDQFQDLYIHIKKGVQTLMGADAEGIVRFRHGYANADLGRIEMQQLFMKAFVKEMLSESNQLNKAKIITKMFNEGYITTNMSLTDALLYAGDLVELKSESFNMQVIPGSPKTIDRASYFIIDQEATNQLFTDILGIVEEEGTAKDISSKGLKIEILNGTDINGLASEYKEKLEDDELTITQIGNYGESNNEKTRIIVSKKGMGNDLKKYFNEPEIVVEELPDNIDIRIIIGDDK
ncbi:MAG: uncharacterized protein K0R15_2305 [Clostridiales bacterium]|nr:uncharacterized protein [Clostridiales bacterium]